MLSLVDRYGESPEAGIRLDEVLAEDKAILANYLKQLRDRSGPSRKSQKGTIAMTSDGRLLQALLRNDFRVFVEKVFMTLTPGQTYIRSWHLEAIAYQLERVRRGEIKRLIINMPPRSLKSIMASVAFPAFILGLDPIASHHLRQLFRRACQKAFQ